MGSSDAFPSSVTTDPFGDRSSDNLSRFAGGSSVTLCLPRSTISALLLRLLRVCHTLVQGIFSYGGFPLHLV